MTYTYFSFYVCALISYVDNLITVLHHIETQTCDTKIIVKVEQRMQL